MLPCKRCGQRHWVGVKCLDLLRAEKEEERCQCGHGIEKHEDEPSNKPPGECETCTQCWTYE